MSVAIVVGIGALARLRLLVGLGDTQVAAEEPAPGPGTSEGR